MAQTSIFHIPYFLKQYPLLNYNFPPSIVLLPNSNFKFMSLACHPTTGDLVMTNVEYSE